MNAFNKFVIMFFLFLSCSPAFGQSRSQLENERNKIIEQIELTSKNLKETESNKKATLADLRAIESQIEKRKELIQNIRDQLKNADKAIAENEGKIDSLNNDMKSLHAQFQKLARNMYIRNLASNKWAYIFSANSVNTAFLRWRYSKQFEAYVQQKTKRVQKLKGNLDSKTNSIIEEKNYVKELLVAEKKNFDQLEQDQNKKDRILDKLSKEESTLRSNLQKKKEQRESLNKEIEKIILEELSRSREKKNTTVNSSSKGITRKNLFWPAKGYVSGKFGNQNHPTLKNVKINNNGIDITCASSAPVSVVADGVVIGITSIPGYDNMVIVQHGDYYSVYSKLTHVIVKKDEKLQSGQTIGRLNNSAAPELHFEFWKEKNKLNPLDWLR